MKFELLLKGVVVSAVVSFFTFLRPMRNVFWETCGVLGTNPRTKSPPSFGQFVSGNIMAADMTASRGFSTGVVKVLVSFYKSGEDSAFERHRSRVTFDLASHSNVAAVKIVSTLMKVQIHVPKAKMNLSVHRLNYGMMKYILNLNLKKTVRLQIQKNRIQKFRQFRAKALGLG